MNFELPGGFAGWFEVPFATPITLPSKDAACDADRLIIAFDENRQVWWGVGNEPRQFSRIEITFDNLLASRHDQPWESGRRVHPMLAKAFELSIQDHDQWIAIARENQNYHRFRRHTFAPVSTDRLRLRILETHGGKGQARVYQIAVFEA